MLAVPREHFPAGQQARMTLDYSLHDMSEEWQAENGAVIPSTGQPRRSTSALGVAGHRRPSLPSAGSGGTFRHHLLKTNAASPRQAAERHLPVPPVLTQVGGLLAAPSSHARHGSVSPPNAIAAELCARIRLDPKSSRTVSEGDSRQDAGRQADAAGLVQDARVHVDQVPHVETVDATSSPGTADSYGHAMKVGPAMEAPDTQSSVVGACRGESKVRPACDTSETSLLSTAGRQKYNILGDDRGQNRLMIYHSDKATATGLGTVPPACADGDKDEDGLHHEPKVRPSVMHTALLATRQDRYPNDYHEGHIWVGKVQSYDRNRCPPLAADTDQYSIPRVFVPWTMSESTVASVPAASDAACSAEQVKMEEDKTAANEVGTALASSQGNHDSLSRSVASGGPENQGQGATGLEPASHRDVGRHGAGPKRSSTWACPATGGATRSKPADEYGGGLFRQGLDARRTAQWLRELLKQKVPATAQLTQLPEKRHGRHKVPDADESRGHNDHDDAAALSRVATAAVFSRETAADTAAMDEAVRHLERLLAEALDIANQVATNEENGENDENRHVDDRHLPSRQLDRSADVGDLSGPASVHESARSDSSSRSEEKEGGKAPTLPGQGHGVFVGAVPDLVHGCEGLALRSVRRHPDLTLDVHNGIARGPVLPTRCSSLRLGQGGGTSRRPASHQLSGPRSKEWAGDRLRVSMVEEGLVPRQMAVGNGRRSHADVSSLDGSDDVDEAGPGHGSAGPRPGRGPDGSSAGQAGVADTAMQREQQAARARELRNVSLRGKSYVSIRDARFNLTRSKRRQPIARDWSPLRKRFVAAVACISTALIGVLVGIYTGIVPSVQYYIADFNHYSNLGNVLLYLGLALPTLLCWPLPLLHGRKPYIMSSLAVAMPLLFPQAAAVSAMRSPNTSVWRWALLLSRALMGLALGFASMNFHSILTDLFGASLMSSKPHQELVDDYDVRRHGGGLGVWLGIWTWSFIGSLSLGFVIGALVINGTSPAWGLYISIVLIAVVLFLNVLTPEVRRSAWRRSVAQVRTGTDVSRRLARGEVMMHRVKTGPKWWGQELYHGAALSLEMLRQPGFAVMALYMAWIYAQAVLLILLLGSLASRNYHLRPPYVASAVSSVGIGALLAVPFQKANIFSRARYRPGVSDGSSLDKNVTWTSHLVRRAIFVILLPVAGAMYALLSSGPPISLAVPCLFAAMVGFLSCLAMSECNGVLMESWDTSDLQPGMTGRSKGTTGSKRRVNYSSFPRVTAGYAVVHGLGFILAACATAVGGTLQRNVGQRKASAMVAAILLLLSLLLLCVLLRFRKIKIIPDDRCSEMDRWHHERRASVRRLESAIAKAKATGQKDVSHIHCEDVGWRPIIIGNPLDKHRRMNFIEMGHLTRWSEIRKRNHMIDEGTQMNRLAFGMARSEMGRMGMDAMEDMQRQGAKMGELVGKASKRSLRSKRSADSSSSSDSEAVPVARRGEADNTTSSSGARHRHPPRQAGGFMERECVMDQTLAEADEEQIGHTAEDDTFDDTGEDVSSGERASHAVSKVQPYAAFEPQQLQGGQERQMVRERISRETKRRS